MRKTGKNKRLLASILAASMLLAMSPFALAEGTEGQEQSQEQSQSTEVKTENVGGSGSESSSGSESGAAPRAAAAPRVAAPLSRKTLQRLARTGIRLLLKRWQRLSRATPLNC